MLRRSLLTIVLALAAAPGWAQIKPGPWQKQHVPDGWVLHETPNYQIQSQCSLEKAKRLGEHKQGAKQYPIKLFKDRKSFVDYGHAPGAAAYYSPTAHEMVCYDTGNWSDEAEPPAAEPDEAGGEGEAAEALQRRLERMRKLFEMDLLGAAAHEGWHQYFHWYVVSWVPLPSWINEGMGDYFYTAIPKKVRGKKVPAELGRQFPMRLATIKSAVEQDKHVPVAELLQYSQQQYYSNPGVCYAEGWALCQYLLHSGNPKYAKVIPIFVRLVRDDTNMAKVTEKAFKEVDLAQLERDFLAWVKQQEIL